MFIAALLVGREPQCPSTGKWMNKLWYSHLIKYLCVTVAIAYDSMCE